MRVSFAFAVLAALTLAGCTEKDSGYQGWIEANLIFVGPDEAGRIETLSVREGDAVTKGDPLFTIDADLQRADLMVSQASVTNAKQAFERAQSLLKTSAGTQKNYDDAEAALRTAQARLNSAQTRLDRRTVVATVDGRVQQVYFRPGEMVAPGRPIISLLPPGNIKVRFYVPEAVLPTIAYGDVVTVRCDGCTGDLTAKVSFISRSAEFTPPVIYSQEERAKLVFLIEALPTAPGNVRVGQPVDVRLAPKEAAK